MMSSSALQSSTISKKKGRTKDEKNIKHFVNENKEQIFSALDDQMKSGFKLLFLSKTNSILQKFHTEMPFHIETKLIRDTTAPKMKDEITTILSSRMIDKIRPEQSIYVGNLFNPEDTNNKRFFKFGKVYNPTSYIANILNVKPIKTIEDSRIMSTSPDQTADMEFENHSFVESKPNSVGRHPFDDMMSSHSSSHKNTLLTEELVNEFPIQNKDNSYNPERSTMLYSKLQELNKRISSRLGVKLRNIKAKELTLREFEEEIELSFGTQYKGFFENKSQLLGKRRGNFEDDASNEYVNKKLEKMKRPTSIFDTFDTNFKAETYLEMSSKIKSLNFAATNEMDTCPIMKRIKADESIKTNQNNEQQWEKEAILEYKPSTSKSSIVVYGRDLQRLDQNSYLNDTLIQFYLKFVHNELMEESKRDSVHIYNTFFLERLRASGKSLPNGFQDGYNNVKKWTKDVDVFEKDFLVFPMNDRNGRHWNLFILCYPRYFLEKSEHGENSTQRKPLLLYFDSMNVLPQQDPEIPKLISCYMQFELKDKKPSLYNQIQSRLHAITENQICQVIVPFQENLFDCGIYMLEYAEKFLTEPEKFLNDITINRDKLNLFPKSIFRNKRADLASIILNLAKGDQNVAKEYKKNRQARIEAANENPEEFEVINEEDTISFLNDELNVHYEDLAPEQRAHVKLIVYKQAHENELARILSSKMQR